MPKYTAVTLTEQEVALVVSGLRRGRHALGERILEGEAQGMDEPQLAGLRDSLKVSLALSGRILRGA